jgi:hypothetical protein
LKTVAIVAGAVALVATGVGVAIGGAGVLAGISGATFATIGTIAGLVSTAVGIGAQLLTEPPPARGSETQIQIAVEPPSPYLMGEAFSAGILRYRRSYGTTLNKIPNPYRWMVVVVSVAGPLAACTQMADFSSDLSYYSGFLDSDTQLGASPEASALVPPFGAAPGWTAASKLSGQAAIGWNLKFDKDGKRFASGVPALGAVWQGVAVYDPRLDDTYPGGAGPQRIDDEATWEYSDNPALHAVAYAYGRYQNGKKVFGIGQPAEGIVLSRFVAWANVCDANGWRLSGTIYEPGDRYANLKDIMSAGCGEPIVTGGMLSVRFRAPQVSLATITEGDIADDDFGVTAMQGYADRLNGLVPKYRSPEHNWEFVSADKVSVPTYVAEDGEEKVEERQWNLVRDVDQASQLAAYALMDSRELGPLEVTLNPLWRWIKPGDCLTADFPSLDFNGDVIVLQREVDPGTMKVKLTLIGETTAKHAYALGLTGTPPPTPALGQTAQERDELAAAVVDPLGARTLVSKSVNFPLSSDDDSISVAAFDGVTNTGQEIAFPAATITGLAAGTDYVVAWSTATSTYSAEAYPAAALSASPDQVLIGRQSTSTGGVYDDPEPAPPGYCVADDTPILLADGTEIAAGALEVGTLLRTRHEATLAWGEYPVAAISFHDEDVFACTFGDVTIRATAMHRFLIDRRWVCAQELGTPAGTARVAKITVAEAHTYISAGVISHNIKSTYYEF